LPILRAFDASVVSFTSFFQFLSYFTLQKPRRFFHSLRSLVRSLALFTGMLSRCRRLLESRHVRRDRQVTVIITVKTVNWWSNSGQPMVK
jgi:hypothetical protein